MVREKLSVLQVIVSIQQHLSGIYIVIWGNYKDYMSGVYFYSKTWNVELYAFAKNQLL